MTSTGGWTIIREEWYAVDARCDLPLKTEETSRRTGDGVAASEQKITRILEAWEDTVPMRRELPVDTVVQGRAKQAVVQRVAI